MARRRRTGCRNGPQDLRGRCARRHTADRRSGGRELEAGIGLLALIVKAGLAASNGEARRHVQGGAVKINDVGVSDERMAVGSAQAHGDGVIKLSLGKKKHFLIKPV